MFDNLSDVMDIFFNSIVYGFGWSLLAGFLSWAVWYLIVFFKSASSA